MLGEKKKLLVRLRKETLAPFNECLKALEESGYEYDKAKSMLFKKSIRQGDFSTDGDSSLPEGKIFEVHSQDYSVSALFCIRAETDFVTNSADFKKLSSEVSSILLDFLLSEEDIESLNLEKFLKLKSSEDDLSVEEKVSSLSSITKETIKITDLLISPSSKKENCICLSYVHHNNKLGAILALKTGEKTDLNNISEIKKLVLHYAASNSLFLTEEEVNPSWLEDEKNKLRESLLAKNPNMPNIENIIEKQIAQSISKVTFTNQEFVLDSSIKISQILFHNGLIPIWGQKIVIS